VGPAFVCSHLLQKQKPLGFHEAPFDPEDPEPQGWCDACEKAVQSAGDWTDDLAEWADIKLVCEFCFAGLRDFHKPKGQDRKTH
jgi:hypothetical protein